ncbi:hypothetical protein HCU01_25870 [Halomonas cupida]|uniref:Uncharacterized protein n=1 Tax=Halomonas cupida TaxID=44933 RepID=A0ABQ0WJ35_9GAMM|nr:hypothetical protein HCU01_25870 [Halomonas cupida]
MTSDMLGAPLFEQQLTDAPSAIRPPIIARLLQREYRLAVTGRELSKLLDLRRLSLELPDEPSR